MGKTVKKTLNIDLELLREAREACGAETDTTTIRRGLEALVRHAAYERLRKLLGTEHGPVYDVPRRREPPAPRSRRHAAAAK